MFTVTDHALFNGLDAVRHRHFHRPIPSTRRRHAGAVALDIIHPCFLCQIGNFIQPAGLWIVAPTVPLFRPSNPPRHRHQYSGQNDDDALDEDTEPAPSVATSQSSSHFFIFHYWKTEEKLQRRSDSTIHPQLLANRSNVNSNHPQLRRGTASSSNRGLVTVSRLVYYRYNRRLQKHWAQFDSGNNLVDDEPICYLAGYIRQVS